MAVDDGVINAGYVHETHSAVGELLHQVIVLMIILCYHKLSKKLGVIILVALI